MGLKIAITLSSNESPKGARDANVNQERLILTEKLFMRLKSITDMSMLRGWNYKMKIKAFANSGDKIEGLVNEWLSKNEKIKILNRSITADWVGPVVGSDGQQIVKCMITIIYEYEQMQEEHENE